MAPPKKKKLQIAPDLIIWIDEKPTARVKRILREIFKETKGDN